MKDKKKREVEIVKDRSNPSSADIIDAFARAKDHLAGPVLGEKRPHAVVFKVKDDDGKVRESYLRVRELKHLGRVPGRYAIVGSMSWTNDPSKTLLVSAEYDYFNRSGSIKIK